MNENMPRSGDASGGTSRVRETVREKAAGLTEDAKQQARAQYDAKKEVARGELDTLASALRRAGTDVGDSGGMSGRLISTLADRIESFSRSIEGKELDDVVYNVERFARRNPAAFLGSAVAIGFLASRFLKSSSTRSWDDRDFYGSEGYEAYARDRIDSATGSTGYGTTYGSELDTGSELNRAGGFGTQGARSAGSTVETRQSAVGDTGTRTPGSSGIGTPGTGVSGTIDSGSDFGTGSDSGNRGGTRRR